MIPKYPYSADNSEGFDMAGAAQGPLEMIQGNLERWAFHLLEGRSRSSRNRLDDFFRFHDVDTSSKRPLIIKDPSKGIKEAISKIKHQITEERSWEGNDQNPTSFPSLPSLPSLHRLQESVNLLIHAVYILSPEEYSWLFCEQIRQNTRELVLSILQLVVAERESKFSNNRGEFHNLDGIKLFNELSAQILKACDALIKSFEAGKTQILGEKIDDLLSTLQISVLGYTDIAKVTNDNQGSESGEENCSFSFKRKHQRLCDHVSQEFWQNYKLWLTKIHFIRRLLRSVDKIFVKSTFGKDIDEMFERANKIVWGVEIVMYQLMVNEAVGLKVNRVAEEVDETIFEVLGELKGIHPKNQKLLKLLGSWEKQFNALSKDILESFESFRKNSSGLIDSEYEWSPSSESIYTEESNGSPPKLVFDPVNKSKAK